MKFNPTVGAMIGMRVALHEFRTRDEVAKTAVEQWVKVSDFVRAETISPSQFDGYGTVKTEEGFVVAIEVQQGESSCCQQFPCSVSIQFGGKCQKVECCCSLAELSGQEIGWLNASIRQDLFG